MQKVSFSLNDIRTDLIITINGEQTNPTTAKDFIYNQPNPGVIWIEVDERGVPVLCMLLQEYTNMVLTLTDDQGNNPYVVEPSSFVGGRPIHRPNK